MTTYLQIDPDQLSYIPNKLVDFGPPLSYPELCTAYSVQRLSLWTRTTEQTLEIIPLVAPKLSHARSEGMLYSVTDEELISLDEQRHIGVHFERKRVAVLVPTLDHNGKLITVYAQMYVGKTDYWYEKIEYAQTVLRGEGEYQIFDKVLSENPVLHQRYKFLPEPHSPYPEYDVLPGVRKKVKRKNKEAMRRIYFETIRRGVKNFINDE